MSANSETTETNDKAFRMVMESRTMLLSYVRAIVRDSHLAEDTLQDTAVQIVKMWHKYDQARPFALWARGIARRVALANLRKAGRQPAILDTAILDAVACRVEQQGSQAYWDQQKELLQQCLKRLPQKQRRLVELRYHGNHDYNEIALILKRSVDSLYTAFSRIHKALHDCIRKQGNSA